ncbi:GNAT family N-acetyltransferase [Piscinibacter terrae]|uniref:GNAT family N-acetyltransferase n=1 Tax=Piscinibacter terrae TaxID=2496871 RepID=A0A3N7HSA9_9BURK|nr:GNAT family N-acetyltransferase [Albitalea terrae]RQP25178.1 GNAT family N-acetyltransferase [Albitalea terrae]
MPLQLTLRPALPDDASVLAAFASTAFRDTYRDLDDPQDIADYVAEHFTPEVLAQDIADPSCMTLLAEADSVLVGYAVIKQSSPPDCVEGPAPIELARLYLGHKHIGRGYGAQLMLAVHAEARRQGAQTLWLGVYDRNLRAVRFYEQFGFRKVGGKEFLFGGQVYIDPIYAAPVRGNEWSHP